jgi:hypothetical protein
MSYSDRRSMGISAAGWVFRTAWVSCMACALASSGCKSPPIPVHDTGLQANPVRYLRYALRGETSGFYIEA